MSYTLLLHDADRETRALRSSARKRSELRRVRAQLDRERTGRVRSLLAGALASLRSDRDSSLTATGAGASL